MIINEKTFTPKDSLSLDVLEWKRTQNPELLKGIYSASVKYIQCASAGICHNFPHQIQDFADEQISLIWDRLMSYNGSAEFKTYLFGCIANSFRDQGRKKHSTDKKTEWAFLQAVRKESQVPNPSAKLEHGELLSRINHALSALPESHRLLWRIYLTPEGETSPYKEISRTTGRSDDSIRAILYRTRTYLRKELSSYLLAG